MAWSFSARCVHRASVASWRIANWRHVSSAALDKLSAAFDTRSLVRQDFKLWQRSQGLFLYEELRDADGFLRMRDAAVSECRALVAEACSSQRGRKMVLVFDELSDALCRVADLAEFVRVAHPQASFRHAATEACVSISRLVEEMNTNVSLFAALSTVVTHGDHVTHVDAVDRHVAALYLHDFEQTGIQLDESRRNTVVQLIDTALQAGQQFLDGTHLPARVDKSLVPSELAHLFERDGGSLLVAGLMPSASCEQHRRTAYQLFMTPDQRQLQLLTLMLTSRHQLATMCGFQSFAHRALRGSLAGCPDTVRLFLDQLRDLSWDDAQRDYDTMTRIKQRHSSEPLAVWDIAHLCHQMELQRRRVATTSPSSPLQQQHNDVDTSDAQMSEYFSVGVCMRGLSELFSRLYGVELQAMEPAAGELWAPDVQKLAVVHETEGVLGYIYCDFFVRANKPRQDCHFTVRCGRELPDGSYQLPVVVLMLSLGSTVAAGGAPCWSRRPPLLSHAQLEVLFHEMGHAMHSMLGRTRYQHVAGTRCSTDFAEVPSVLMEHFAGDWRVLAAFGRHYVTGQPPPEPALRRFCTRRAVFPAAELQLQLFYAVADQHLHSCPPDASCGLELLEQLQRQYYGLPAVQGAAWHLRFGHLVGYGARYYSYLMARAVAAAIWRQMFEADPFSRTMGERYRRQCLSHGGGVAPADIVSGLLGAGHASPHAMARAVLDQLHQSAEQNGGG